MADTTDEPGPYAKRLLAWTTQHDAKERRAIRHKARAQIDAAIEAVATRHGYTRHKHAWIAARGMRRNVLSVQPSRYGFECFINLRVGKHRWLGAVIGHAGSRNFRLGAFYDKPWAYGGEPGALSYGEVFDAPEFLARACYVLDTRALPFLERRENRPHDIATYLPTCPPLPARFD